MVKSLLGVLKFTEKLFLHCLAFCDKKYLINYKFKRRYICLGLVFLWFGSSFFTAYQSVAFFIDVLLTELVNKEEELGGLGNRKTDLGGE